MSLIKMAKKFTAGMKDNEEKDYTFPYDLDEPSWACEEHCCNVSILVQDIIVENNDINLLKVCLRLYTFVCETKACTVSCVDGRMQLSFICKGMSHVNDT